MDFFWQFVFGILWMATLIIFVVLKLAGALQWPWVWVLSPLWIYLSIALILSGYFWLRHGRELNMWPWKDK